ncbi:hypothetical protein PMAYCL1PPCAC_19231, partial [Pristionchus mayeri]
GGRREVRRRDGRGFHARFLFSLIDPSPRNHNLAFRLLLQLFRSHPTSTQNETHEIGLQGACECLPEELLLPSQSLSLLAEVLKEFHVDSPSPSHDRVVLRLPLDDHDGVVQPSLSLRDELIRTSPCQSVARRIARTRPVHPSRSAKLTESNLNGRSIVADRLLALVVHDEFIASTRTERRPAESC